MAECEPVRRGRIGGEEIGDGCRGDSGDGGGGGNLGGGGSELVTSSMVAGLLPRCRVRAADGVSSRSCRVKTKPVNIYVLTAAARSAGLGRAAHVAALVSRVIC